MKENTFSLRDKNKLEMLVSDDKWIFFYSDSFSGQVPLNEIGVKIDIQPRNIKVGFLSTTQTQTYFCFYFELDQEKKLRKFFNRLGFKG